MRHPQERTLEVATLQRQVRAAEDGIQHAERELATAKDRLLTAETDAQSLRKQLQAAQVGDGGQALGETPLLAGPCNVYVCWCRPRAAAAVATRSARP